MRLIEIYVKKNSRGFVQLRHRKYDKQLGISFCSGTISSGTDSAKELHE